VDEDITTVKTAAGRSPCCLLTLKRDRRGKSEEFADCINEKRGPIRSTVGVLAGKHKNREPLKDD